MEILQKNCHSSIITISLYTHMLSKEQKKINVSLKKYIFLHDKQQKKSFSIYLKMILKVKFNVLRFPSLFNVKLRRVF